MTTDFVPPERLVRPEFTVRCYFPGDGAAMSEAVCASYDHLSPWMPWATPDQSVELSERLARQFRGRWLLNTDFVLGVWDPAETRLVGGTGFHLRHGGIEVGTAEIGMWIRGDVAHRGLGTAVLAALIEWGFTEWPWQKLVWRCDADNLASVRCAEKAGMKLEGRLRSHELAVDGSRRDTLVFGAVRPAA